MKTKNFKSEKEIRVAIVSILGITSEPFTFGKSVTIGEKGMAKTKIVAVETAGEDEVYITAESNSDICWDDLTIKEQTKLYKAIAKQVNESINHQNSNNMEEVKNEAVKTAQVENENVESQAPAVENQEQVEKFLARHPEFTCVDMRESIPFASGCGISPRKASTFSIPNCAISFAAFAISVLEAPTQVRCARAVALPFVCSSCAIWTVFRLVLPPAP